MSFEEEYSKLNTIQKLAVDTIQGPVMVVAGPGTGKTQILSVRIANILNLTDTSPENILALTFTDNAAQNMKERLVGIIGATGYKVNISTFHSFANDVIMTFPEKFSYKKDLTQIDEYKKYKIFEDIINNFEPKDEYEIFQDKFTEPETDYGKYKHLKPFSDTYFNINGIISAIDQFKREFIGFEKINNTIEGEIEVLNTMEKINKRLNKPTGKWKDKYKAICKNIELLYVYKKYDEQCIKEGYYDYSDMIKFVVEAFQKDDELLAYYQERFLYILVDEFQDSNGAQNEIIKLLGNWDDSPNIFAVGDDDQSIYKFQGASLANIMEFKKFYPTSKLIVLEENYRSSQQILNVAEKSIKNNGERLINRIPELTKKLKANSEYKNLTENSLNVFTKEDFEYNWIAEKVQQLIKDGVSPKEIAVIYPRHSIADELAIFLNHYGIQYSLSKDVDIWSNNFLLNLISLLEFISNPYDDILCSQILMNTLVNLRSVDAFKVIDKVYRRKIAEESLIIELLNIETLNEKYKLEDAMKFNDFANKVVELFKIKSNYNFLYTYENMLESFNIAKNLYDQKDYKSLNILKTISNLITSRVKKDPDYLLKNFIDEINTLREHNLELPVETLESSTNKVNLMTIHKAKGLEFEYVFLPKLIDKVWGNSRGGSNFKLLDYIDSDDIDSTELKIEEERRQFYVALTRAKRQILFTYSEEYLDSDLHYKKAIKSQFLEEVFENVKENKVVCDEKTSEKIFTIIPNSIKNIIDYTEEEREYLLTKLNTFKLSPSSLNSFLIDKEIFIKKYLIKLPEQTNKSLALGNAVHNTLELFFKDYNATNNVPSFELLTINFEDHLKKEFSFHPDYEHTREEGILMLKKWFEFNKSTLIHPIHLEYGFYGHNTFIDSIPLVGKIDKMEWVDKERNEIKIIDYKTGSPKTRSGIVKPLDGDNKSNIYRQLVFYVLLSKLDNKFPYKVVSTEIQYIKEKDGKFSNVQIEIPEEDIEAMKELIRKSYKEIVELIKG